MLLLVCMAPLTLAVTTITMDHSHTNAQIVVVSGPPLLGCMAPLTHVVTNITIDHSNKKCPNRHCAPTRQVYCR